MPSEVTFETFKEAAQQAVTNLDEGADAEADGRTELRTRFKSLLGSQVPEADFDLDASTDKVVEQLIAMLWHDEDHEVRARAEEKRIDHRAMKRFMEMLMEQETEDG